MGEKRSYVSRGSATAPAAESSASAVDACRCAPGISTGDCPAAAAASSAAAPHVGLAIEAHGLVKQFGARRALDGVDLAIPRGAFLSIFGSNGAGKTTLLRELALLARPTKGTLKLLGIDALEEPDALRARVGLISHASMLYGDLTARENLEFYASLYGMPKAEAARRIDELLRLVELDHRQNDRARTFSRGMQQRLSIARALVNDPELVLLDEPYAGLDPHASELLDQLIDRVRAGRTFVMVSHDLDRGFDVCTHALIMAQGRVVVCAPKDTVDREAFFDLYRATVGMGVA
ncbi:MAG: ABC transporter ATP-binding protein [Coriobacteriaceae bacterium]|nr:ABC transporter ATP-binding protein [Coriobacteriaceae bacterium]